MDVTIRPLTPDLWPALEALFDTTGPVGRCWCMYWRIGSRYRQSDPQSNRKAFHTVVEEGPPPGLVALQGAMAVGWCQLTTRAAVPWIDQQWRLAPVDDVPVWRISCFYVRNGFRRRGVTAALIDAAIDHARHQGAEAIEAYPLDSDATSTSSHTGYLSTFERAGFEEVIRRDPARPIVRLYLSDQ